MWVFALPWAGWSCEIASEASEVGVCRWKRSGLSGRDLNSVSGERSVGRPNLAPSR